MLARRILFAATVAATLAIPSEAHANRPDLRFESEHALQKLYRGEPFAEAIAGQAKAILVFPSIVKAGFVFGGSFGEGVLFYPNDEAQYYNSLSGSWGLQAGIQSYGYALFLMNDRALEYLEKSDGWELGVGPTIVLVNAGAAKNLSTTTLNDDVYAFVFDQEGLMAGLAIEGSKISQIDP